MKSFKAAAGFAMLALAFPAAAVAHTGAATVSCTAASFSFMNFATGVNTISYKITVDGTTSAEGTFTLNAAGGREGTLALPLTLHDTHQVRAFAWWGPGGVQDQNTRPASAPALADKVLYCPAAVTAPAPAPVVVAPAVVPPVAAAPVPALAAPAIGVLSETARSAPSVRLAVQPGCASRHVRVTVSARLMSRVRISVNGKLARTVNVRSGARSITTLVPLRRLGSSVQTVTTRISFRNGAPARRLSSPARRCSRVAVVPQFTG
jgi:hypothetical protein